MPDNDKIQLPKGFKLDQPVETPNVKLPKGFTLDTEVVKKKEQEVSPYVSAPTKSPLQSPDFSQGEKMAEVGYTMPSGKKEKEKIRISPKIFGMPGQVDVEVVEDDETYRNTAQRFTNDLLKGSAEIGAYLSEVMRDMGAGQARGIAKLTGNKEAKKISQQLGSPLYDAEGNATDYAKSASWATDPSAKTILGLNGIKENTEQLQESTKLPQGFVGGTIESVSSFAPDILFATLAPETKLAEGAGLIARVGKVLINPFTKYLMVKEPLVAYGKAKREGGTPVEALKETPMGLVKGTATGVGLALTGKASEVATKGIMQGATKYLLGTGSTPASKGIINKAAELGLTGKGGVATKELVNTLTDVVGYSLIYPTAASLMERGELPSEEEIMAGIGPAVAFRIKGAYENAKTFGELNKAVDQIQATKQGAAFVNFMEATPESILKVYNGKETAAELQLQAIEAAKRAKAEVDPVEKQKAVIQASTLAKAANVKQMADMVVSNKDGFQDFLNSEIPQVVKDAFIEKATAINKATNPTEQLKTSLGNRMKQSQDFIEKMERDMQVEQDPVRKTEMQVQIDNANKVYKQQEAELKKLIFDQFQPRSFDANDIKSIKENQRLDNLEIDTQIANLDRNDPDFAEKIESLTKRKEDQNDYYDEILKQNKEGEESGVSVISPDEMNQIDATEISFEPRVKETEVKPTEVIEKDNNGNFVPKKFTLNKAAPVEEQAPTISIESIKEESFGGEMPTDVKQVKLLEVRGRNADGETVGTVWIQNSDGTSFTAEVKFNEKLASLEGGKTEVKPTEVKEAPKQEERLGKSLIREEPTQAEGVVIATETGLTEQERLDKIAQREKQTKISDKVNLENALVQETKLFYEKNKRQRSSSEGLRKLNELRTRARELGLEIDDLSESVVRKKGSRKTKIKYNSKAEADSVIDKSAKTIYERRKDVQDVFKMLNENKVFLDFKTDLGVRASDAQLDATIQDILDGVPSKRANRYLDEVQKAIDNDAFGLKDMGNNALTLEQILESNRDINKIEKEVVGEPMGERELEAWLNDQSKLIPEEEAIMIDDFENLLNEYEYENETKSEGKVPAVEPAAEERVDSKAEPTEVNKKTAETTVIEAKKEVTLQDLYQELPKSEKLRNKQIQEMVDKNFDSIKKQLEKYKIC